MRAIFEISEILRVDLSAARVLSKLTSALLGDDGAMLEGGADDQDSTLGKYGMIQP